MMSNISYDWIVLGVAAILLAVLSFLKRKKCRVYYTRAACNGIRHHFGNCFQRPYRLCRCGGFHLVQCNYRTGGSAAAVQHYLQHHEPWRIHTLKEYWSKTVFFLLLNTATASLLTLILAQAFQLGRWFPTTPCRAITNNMTFLPFSTTRSCRRFSSRNTATNRSNNQPIQK